ncbi:MAG: hypothetical protein K6F62_03940 [Schwartzia sp.]|nr:hypothetical protein [Schwartzia sp. (in: firmicutes)]
MKAKDTPIQPGPSLKSAAESTLAALKESENICNGNIPAKSYSSAAELIREAQEELGAEN